MRIRSRFSGAALICALGLSVSLAQDGTKQGGPSITTQKGTNGNRGRKPARTLSYDDRLSVIAAALDSKLRLNSQHDCSHLVHAVYGRAGFPYPYASSSDLYEGVDGFERVAQPQTGDLVVWRGHVGIVIRPLGHVFFSFTHAGPGIDDYESAYWKSRGSPRFYRYIKSDGSAGRAHSRSVADVKPHFPSPAQ
jgi:NlpC/P60 family